MTAMLLMNDIVIGYNDNIAACVTSGLPFVEVEEVPASFYSLNDRQYLRYVDDEFVVVDRPPEPSNPLAELQAQVAQLQAKNDELVLIVGDLALGGL